MGSSSARQADLQEGISSSSARQAEPQEGMSSSAARQAEPQEGMSPSATRQVEPQEGMSSSSACQAEPMEEISCSSEQRTKLLALQAALRSKQDACEKLATRLWRCNFIYTPPRPHFDTKKVMGTICTLIDVNDPIHCIALEIAAGERLYSVVVDTEPTGRLLLQHGKLQERTIFIPLNVINWNVIDRNTVKIAQEIGEGAENVQLALDLVSFESKYRRAMQYVFGKTLVCRDTKTAKKVAFHPAVQRRVVTLDGDIFDPNGTMTGGAKLEGPWVLEELQELKKKEADMRAAELELALYTAELQSMQEVTDMYDMISQELNIMDVQDASYTHMDADIEGLREQIAEMAVTLDQEKVTQLHTAKRTRELEDRVRANEKHRERDIRKAKVELKKAEEAAEAHAKALKEREQELMTLAMEVSELEKSLAAKKQQLADNAATSILMHASLERTEQKHIAAIEAVKEMKRRIERYKAEAAALDAERAAVEQKKEQLIKRNVEIELQITKLNKDIEELKAEATEWENETKRLEEENPWIATECQHFVPGDKYDFSRIDEFVAKMAELKERKDKLAQGLLTETECMLHAKEEEQCQNVVREEKVEAEKAELVEHIAKLDAEQHQKKKNKMRKNTKRKYTRKT